MSAQTVPGDSKKFSTGSGVRSVGGRSKFPRKIELQKINDLEG